MTAGERCLLCGRQGKDDPQAARRLGLDESSRYRIYRCRICAYRWLSPMPSQEELSALYGSLYFEDPDRCYSYDAQITEQRSCFEHTAARLRGEGRGPRVLDVGAATGDFLAAAQAQGLDPLGVEYSEHACRRCQERGLHVLHGTLDAPQLDVERFDAVHASHVFEHLPDPVSAVRRIHDLLHPDGLLYLEVPLQFDGVLDVLNKFRHPAPGLTPWSFHHRSFFSPRSLAALLEQNDFRVLSLTTFLPCKRAGRPVGARLRALHAVLWAADRLLRRGDVIAVWARRTAQPVG